MFKIAGMTVFLIVALCGSCKYQRGTEERSKTSLDKNRFWAIVENSAQRSEGDPERQATELHRQLMGLSAEEIIAFQQHFDDCMTASYRWDLRGAAYIITGGCSERGFRDFRAWLISRGQDIYEGALRDPESLATVIKERDGNCQLDAFQYVTQEVWEQIAGNGTKKLPREAACEPASPAGEKWSEDGDDLELRFPKLWMRFGLFISGPELNHGSIRSVPFRNFTFESCESDDKIVLRDGKSLDKTNGVSDSELVSVKYFDLTYDGREEAVITIRTDLHGSGGYEEEYYVYESRARARMIFHECREQGLGIEVKAGVLIIRAPYWHLPVPHCCPRYVETKVYQWRNAGFVVKSRKIRDNPAFKSFYSRPETIR